jgi:diguanylate cyclase (GGDEF)-like protein/PAS domain S-box-containing protein
MIQPVDRLSSIPIPGVLSAGLGEPDSWCSQSYQATLAESQREFASLLEVLCGTFYRCELTPPWRMKFISQGAQELTGYSLPALEAMGWEELIHPADVLEVRRVVAEAVGRQEPFSVTYRLIRRSGEYRWVREHGKAVCGTDGEALFLEGMISDVTEEYRLKQASARATRAAEASADRLAQVLESTLDGVFSLDREWRITYINSRARTEVFTASELLGRGILEVFPQLEHTPFWPAYQHVMRERKPRRVEGFVPGLDHWYEIHAAPIDDGITIFFRNIDDRKRAENILRERERQLRRTLDHIPQMVWSTRPDGHHDYYSRLWYEFTGVPEGSTDGEGWNAMFHPEDQERAWAQWRRALATGEPYEIEYRLRHHSGEYRWVLGRAWAETNEQNEIVRWYGTCTDIHDRVCAEQALHESRAVQEGVLDASADCIKILAPDGTLEFMNESGLRAMELPSLETVRGRSWPALWPKGGRTAARRAIERALADQTARFSGFCPTVSGKRKWWDVIVTPVKNERGEIIRLLSISRDMTVQRETAELLKKASEQDTLTELPNRRAFEKHLQAATIRAMKSGEQVALLLVDLDHFKHVNDTLGHPAGDAVLKDFARRLLDSVRSTDFVARLGGDESLKVSRVNLSLRKLATQLSSASESPSRLKIDTLAAAQVLVVLCFRAMHRVPTTCLGPRILLFTRSRRTDGAEPGCFTAICASRHRWWRRS